MKKLVTLMFVMTPVTAFAGPITWVRETLFPVQIIERVVEKIVPVLVPPDTGWAVWAILIGVIMILLRGRKVPQTILKRLPVFPKKEETPPVQWPQRHRYCSHGVALAFFFFIITLWMILSLNIVLTEIYIVNFCLILPDFASSKGKNPLEAGSWKLQSMDSYL